MSFITVVAGEHIEAGVALSLNTAGHALTANPFSSDRSRVVGISAEAAISGSRVRIVLSDFASVSTAGMTINKQAYLSVHGSGVLTTDFNSVASGYTDFYDPFFVTKVGNALTPGVLKIEIEDGVLTLSPNNFLLTENSSPLIECLVAEDGSKILLEDA